MNLADQVKLLEERLVDSIASQRDGSLSHTDKAFIAAYLVLCHACIEEYLEDAFAAHFARLAGFFSCRVVPREAADLLFVLGLQQPADLAYNQRNFKAALARGRLKFDSDIVEPNHGVRPENLQKLASAVGVNWEKMETDLTVQVAALDTLSSKRGRASHTSPFSGKAVVVEEIVYPVNATKWVDDARVGAEAIGRYLHDLVEDRLGGAHEALLPALP